MAREVPTTESSAATPCRANTRQAYVSYRTHGETLRTSTLILTDLALRHGGVRAASRAARVPVSTISAALTRVEDSLSLKLVRRSQTGLVPTVQAARLAPAISEMADIARAIHQVGPDEVPECPASLAALFRLAAVTRLGSIRRAASEMGVGQPQLTRQIAQVESNHGQVLLHRGSKGISLTPEGERVVRLIERFELAWRAFTGEATPVYTMASRRFALGSIIPATARGNLAHLVATITSRLYMQKGVTITVASAIAEDLLTGLDTGRFDVVLVDTDLHDPAYRQHELERTPVAIVGRGLPRQRPEQEELTEILARKPFVLQSRRSGLRQRAESFLNRYATPDWRSRIPVVEVDSLPVIVNMVAGGEYRSLLPRSVGKTLSECVALDLPSEFDQFLQLTWKRSPKAERFAQEILSGL
ncbi:LysR family transcriptional regulator [Paracoccus denitrificans]|uniref:LysR family transcriptional regulator n=1 Tax=Paracoccus denitrificans TaxID=266 RepID=UPI0013E3E4FE|nr:LysR family transcriptional regulator [Paracoccus denitrificans]MBB4628749.1 DNA-binding transcriptional LysR family regulator [Paracoccus denitrificans]MCU7429888.1 LysR family transcriptional regulator [Paracoccus denitrificans]UPV97913.1 LysR family transcriptional regulator [Paracoccus denitrificans]WQO35828.1 LysR family transcriptional regulator [Paracoccus denitrificans]